MKRALLVMLAACGNFEDPDIVLDFRVLGISATVPEQIVDIDITQPVQPTAVLEQLVDTKICVLISDKNFVRDLRWSMTLCNLNSAERCNDGAPHSVLGSGLWPDPDLTPAAPELCVNVPADGNLLGVLLDALQGDQFKGLGGIYYGISLIVGGQDADPALDLYAAKSLRVQPRIPAELQANNNPFLTGVDVRLAEDGEFAPLRIDAGRCFDYAIRGEEPLVVAPEQKIRFMPVEPEGVREAYVVPTTDGSSRMFNESLTYQWLATIGSFSAGSTGGPRDPFGNPEPLFTDWTAPDKEDVEGPIDVSFWVVQRDERLGLIWYEWCVRVVP